MTTWIEMGGSTYELRPVYRGATRAEAHAYCQDKGAAIQREKIQGTIYSHGYVVQFDPFTRGYVVLHKTVVK